MKSYFIIILYAVEGSEKMLTFCIVAIFRETFRMDWLRKDVFIFNLTGVYLIDPVQNMGKSLGGL